ncbi:MAG: pyridoxamine 5'-phosphate oxidase family protein [Actinomycetota bacterium]
MLKIATAVGFRKSAAAQEVRMRWAELEAERPRLAGLGRRRLIEPGVVLVATIRRDGSPRVSPVEPLLWRGDLWLSMLWGSRKAADILRDDRVLVHSIVTDRDGGTGEFKVRGRAVTERDPGVQEAYAQTVARELGWEPRPGRFHLFRVDVGDVTFIRYDSASGDQFVARWPAGEEFVRRGTSATSVGPPEPHRDLLG